MPRGKKTPKLTPQQLANSTYVTIIFPKDQGRVFYFGEEVQSRTDGRFEVTVNDGSIIDVERQIHPDWEFSDPFVVLPEVQDEPDNA